MRACTNSLRSIGGSCPGLSIRSHVASGGAFLHDFGVRAPKRERAILLGLANDRSVYGVRPLPHTYRIVCEALCPVLSIRSN